MTTCPHCGGALPPELISKGGGNPALPEELRRAGAAAGEVAVRLTDGLVGWRGMVWSPCLARKAAVCWITEREIGVSAPAYRPITNGKDRPRRVAAAVWADL